MAKPLHRGVCVGGAFDGKIVEVPDDTARLVSPAGTDTYLWQPILISGVERVGFWCHDTIGPAFAFQAILGRYER